MLFYPGVKFGYDGPIPSVRLKTMRRGLQDFEYLRLIEKNGKATRAELVRLADDLLLGKTIDYPKLRGAIYELLSGRTHSTALSSLCSETAGSAKQPQRKAVKGVCGGSGASR